jgi:hypothetical protein
MNREYFRDFYYKTITPKILEGLKKYGPYDRALFIECDNGFLIEFIEANEIHGIDDPKIESVPIVKRIESPDKVYDLIVLSEKDYSTYDREQIYDWIIKSASRTIAVIGTQEYTTSFIKVGKPRQSFTILNDIELRIYDFDESLKQYE